MELERECANPIYGSDDDGDNVYTAPDSEKKGLPDPEREFQNIIYGVEDDVNTYSEPTGPAMYATVT